jgi:hypothetical protein
MNEAQLIIKWDKATGQFTLYPANMQPEEILPLLFKTMIGISDGVLEKAKQSGITLATGPLPKVPGN